MRSLSLRGVCALALLAFAVSTLLIGAMVFKRGPDGKLTVPYAMDTARDLVIEFHRRAIREHGHALSVVTSHPQVEDQPLQTTRERGSVQGGSDRAHGSSNEQSRYASLKELEAMRRQRLQLLEDIRARRSAASAQAEHRDVSEQRARASASVHTEARANPPSPARGDVVASVRGRTKRHVRTDARTHRGGTYRSISSKPVTEKEIVERKTDGVGVSTQVMVLGMHHSGTSLLTRLLMEMGLYGGDRSEFKLMRKYKSRLDPPKFWERLDVIALCEGAMRDAHPVQIDPGWLTGFGFGTAQLNDSSRARFKRGFADVVSRLDEHGSWVMKEPRLSVLAPLWRPLLRDNFICVILNRHPYHVATGLRSRPRNRSMSLAQWLALWEKHQLGALHACAQHRTIVVSHDRLARDARLELRRIVDVLNLYGAADVSERLQNVDDTWLDSFLPSHTVVPIEAKHFEQLSERQRRLFSLVEELTETNDEVRVDADLLARIYGGTPPIQWSEDVFTREERDALTSGARVSSSVDGVDDDSVELDDLLRRVARSYTIDEAHTVTRFEVLIIPTNSFFSDLARNQMCSLAKLKKEGDARRGALVVGLDDHVCTAMHGLRTGVASFESACFYNRTFGVGVVDHQRWSMNRNSQYFTILKLKMTYCLSVVERGFDLLLSDADIVHSGLVHEHLRALPTFADTDLFIQSDSRGDGAKVRAKRRWLCAGFFHMKANERTVHFLRLVLALMDVFGAPDQDVFQLLLRGTGQNFEFPPDWRQVARDALAERTEARAPLRVGTADEIGVTYEVLDESLFVNGGAHFREVSGDVRDEAAAPLIVHANMRGFPKKVESFQRKHLWYLDALDKDVCVLS